MQKKYFCLCLLFLASLYGAGVTAEADEMHWIAPSEVEEKLYDVPVNDFDAGSSRRPAILEKQTAPPAPTVISATTEIRSVPGKLFWIFPITLTATITTDPSGRVKTKFPWYHIFVRKLAA